jgi:preprotein translocase SecE subunit
VSEGPDNPVSAGDTPRMTAPGRPAGGRLLLERLNLTFFPEAVAKLRKVHWPTREQTRTLALLVIGVSLAIGLLLGGIDLVFEKIFEAVLGLDR